MSGRVVIVNGPSSVGKSTIARGLQAALDHGWLKVGIDDFLGFVPESLVNLGPSADAGFRWFPAKTTGEEATRIVVGDYGHRVVRGVHRAMAALARSGLDVIVDDVLLEAGWLDDYLEAMAGIDVVFVGVTAPLAVIEEREIARGDRFPRQARGHYDHVHHDNIYDVLVDTSILTPEATVERIVERIEAGPGTAFDELRRRRAPATPSGGDPGP